MTCSKSENNINITHIQDPGPVAQGEIIDREFLHDFLTQFSQPAFRLFIRILVLYGSYRLAMGCVPYQPNIGYHAAAVIGPGLPDYFFRMDWTIYYFYIHLYSLQKFHTQKRAGLSRDQPIQLGNQVDGMGLGGVLGRRGTSPGLGGRRSGRLYRRDRSGTGAGNGVSPLGKGLFQLFASGFFTMSTWAR